VSRTSISASMRVTSFNPSAWIFSAVRSVVVERWSELA
jgi:hypothetical protein